MTPDITRTLALEVCSRTPNNLPDNAWTLTAQCLLDTTGTAIAGAQEPFVEAIRAELIEQGGRSEATVIGCQQPLPAVSAALINGTAAHALDYDDVNFLMSAHASAVIFPAILALGERLNASWSDIVTSYVAGYEAGCRIGQLLEPSHYRMGFHGTATIGTFAAALASAKLLGLSVEQTIHTIGITATQAAGIRAMFGTPCKPLHAGKAAQNGLMSALMAFRGVTSHPQALTATAGFAATHSQDLNIELALAPAPTGGLFLNENLFKYHAACYLTHAVADATAQLRDQLQASPQEVAEVTIVVSPDLDTVCNIPRPNDGLQLKFSVCGVTALTLLRRDTASLSEYNAEIVNDPAFLALLPKIRVEFDHHRDKTVADVTLKLQSGQQATLQSDSGIPIRDLALQDTRLQGKFRSLVTDALGENISNRLLTHYQSLSPTTPIRNWMQATLVK